MSMDSPFSRAAPVEGRQPTQSRYNNNEPSHDMELVGQEPGTGPGPGPGMRQAMSQDKAPRNTNQPPLVQGDDAKEKASSKLRLHPLELTNTHSAYSGMVPSDLASPTKSVSLAGTMTVLSTITPDLKEPALTARKSPPAFAFSSAVSTPSLFAQALQDERIREDRACESRATIPLIPRAQPGASTSMSSGAFMMNTISPLMMAATAAATASFSTPPSPLMMPPATVSGIRALPLPAPISPFLDASCTQASERRELSTDPFQHPAQPFQYQNPLRKPRKPYTISKNRENWSEEEHQRFIDALELFGRDWKSIQNHIETKDVQQIRSHAQKYFAKVSKNNSGEYVPPARPKRKCQQPYPKKSAMMAGGGAASTSPTMAKLPDGTAMNDADPVLAPNAHSVYGNVSAPSESTMQHFATSSESSHHVERENAEREGLLDEEEQRQRLEYLHRMHCESQQHERSVHEQQRQQAARMVAAGSTDSTSSPYGPGIVFSGYDGYGRHPSVLTPPRVVSDDANRYQGHESPAEYRTAESVSAARHSIGGPSQLAGFVARHHGPASGMMHPTSQPLSSLPQTQQQHDFLGDGANGQASIPSMLAGMLRDSSSLYGHWPSASQSAEEHQRMREASAAIPSAALPSLYPTDLNTAPMMAGMPSLMYPTQTYYYPVGYDQIMLNYPGRVMMVTSNPPVGHASAATAGNPAWGHVTSLNHFGAVERTLMRQFSSLGRGNSSDHITDGAESVVTKNEQSVDVSIAQSCNCDAEEAASCVNQHHRKAAHQPDSLHAQNTTHMHSFPHHSHSAHGQHIQHRPAVAEPVAIRQAPVNDPMIVESAVRLEASPSLQQNTNTLSKTLSNSEAKPYVNIGGQAPAMTSEVVPKANAQMDIVTEWKRENSKNASAMEAATALVFAAPVLTSRFLESEILSPARDQESSSDTDNPEPPSDSGSDGSGGRRSLGKSVTGKNGSDSGSDEGMEAGASSGTDQPSSNDIEVTVTIPAGTSVDDRRRMAYREDAPCRTGSGYGKSNLSEPHGSKSGTAEVVPVNRNSAGQHFHTGRKRFRDNGKDSGSDGNGSGSGSGGSGSGSRLASHGMSMDSPQKEHGHLGDMRSPSLRPHAVNGWEVQKGLPESLSHSASRLSSATIGDAHTSGNSSHHDKVDGLKRYHKAHSGVGNDGQHSAKIARPSEIHQEAREEMREMFDAVETLQQLAEAANVSPKKHSS